MRIYWNRLRSWRHLSVMLLLLFIAVFCQGVRLWCHSTINDMSCQGGHILLTPGGCQQIDWPCQISGWNYLHLIYFLDGPDDISFRYEGSDEDKICSICADEDAPLRYAQQMRFFIQESDGIHPPETGGGTYWITVVESLDDVTVVFSVDPDTVTRGESSQLLAEVISSHEGCTFYWVPSSFLDDFLVPNPVSTPALSTDYECTVSWMDVQVEQTLRVSVRLDPTPTATPTNIAVGDSSRLEVEMLGGAPPYAFEWTPANQFSDNTVERPWVWPTTDTTYGVTITDAFGQVAQREVTVTVGAIMPVEVVATATPDTIDVGETVQLQAEAIGGQEPYLIFWYPDNYLDDRELWNPVFDGIGSLDYEARVQSAMGSGQATVRITVRMDPQLTATPPSIAPGDSSQITTYMDGGGHPTKTYAWSPTTGLSHPVMPVTWAKPTETTEYTLTITDAFGQVVHESITVEVTP